MWFGFGPGRGRHGRRRGRRRGDAARRALWRVRRRLGVFGTPGQLPVRHAPAAIASASPASRSAELVAQTTAETAADNNPELIASDSGAPAGGEPATRAELSYATGIRDFRDIAPYDWAMLSGPVHGHPERVIGYVPLTPAERGLWAQLVDLPYR